MASPIVVMGVSGSGKSTVGAALAQRLRVPFADADDFHPPANIAKMTRRPAARRRRPLPLAGGDRGVAGRARADGGVMSCSALKRKYRDQLRHHCPDVEFLHLPARREVIGNRQASRPGHFMPASLLASQFATLEPLEPDERGVVIDVDQNIDSIVDEYVDVSATRQPNRRTDDFDIGPAITILAADTKLVEPVAAGWQLILPRCRHRADRRADHRGEAAPVPRPDLRRPDRGHRRGRRTSSGRPRLVRHGLRRHRGGVGILIALGAMFAKLLADSGGADQIVDTIVGRASPRALPWAMALVGAIIGLPMFFEIGLVLLMPVIYLVARASQLSLITVGIPALAGLSAMHGLVPPHPGPADRDRAPARRPRRHPGVRRARRDPDRHRRRPAVRPPRRPLGGLDVPDRFEADEFARQRRWFGDHCRGGRRG